MRREATTLQEREEFVGWWKYVRVDIKTEYVCMCIEEQVCEKDRRTVGCGRDPYHKELLSKKV